MVYGFSLVLNKAKYSLALPMSVANYIFKMSGYFWRLNLFCVWGIQLSDIVEHRMIGEQFQTVGTVGKKDLSKALK